VLPERPRLVFPEQVRDFSVEVSLVAEMAVYNPFDFFLEPGAEEFPFTYDSALATELAPYLRKDALTPKFEALFKSLDASRWPKNRRTVNRRSRCRFSGMFLMPESMSRDSTSFES